MSESLSQQRDRHAYLDLVSKAAALDRVDWCAQVSMKLKLARMWDHNGTNMEAIGFMYRDYKTLIGLDANQELTGQHPALW